MIIAFLYKYRQLIKFGIVGVANTLISLALIYLFDKVMGLGFQIANPLAYFLATLNSYYLNKKWTFKSGAEARSKKKEGALFFGVIGVAWLIQYAFLFILVKVFLIDDLIAQIMGMFVFTGLNFLGQKYVTFRA